jgi:hypothetical protein
MILRTCAYDKRDGTRCNSPAVKGYDGCYFHSRVLQEKRRRERVRSFLWSARGKVPEGMLAHVAKLLGVPRLPPILGLQLPDPARFARTLPALRQMARSRREPSRLAPRITPAK